MIEDVLSDETIARRPTTAFISKRAIAHNIDEIRARLPRSTEVMAVVKANAYGHGLVPASRFFIECGVERLAVAFLEEGIALRRAGVRAPILVLGGLIGNQVRHFLEYDLELTAASPFKLEQIAAEATPAYPAKVHLLFDTGMERLGVHWDHAETLFRAAENAQKHHVRVEGIFSHFANADLIEDPFTAEQVRRFETVLSHRSAYGLQDAKVHIANSDGALRQKGWARDVVRLGLALYGAMEVEELDLQRALTLETRVVYFKVVREGDAVSYAGTWRAPCDTRVVTLPIGYGDGYPRALSNRSQVLIRGQRCDVVGNITMDATMVDIGPDGTAYNGDSAILIGSQGSEEITASELAERAATIPYEILTNISARVPRVYQD